MNGCEQGAIQMANWELEHGSDPELLNISVSIVASQTEQIQELQQILLMLPTPADCMSSSGPSMVTSSVWLKKLLIAQAREIIPR